MGIAQQAAMIETMNYLNDPRVIAAELGSVFSSVNEITMTAVVVLYDEEGNDEEHTLPISFCVCDTCNGRGSHTNPSVDCGGYDFDEDDFDDYGHSRYMSGAYDVACYQCKGKRVVPQAAPRTEADAQVVARLLQMQADNAASERERRAERMMGA